MGISRCEERAGKKGTLYRKCEGVPIQGVNWPKGPMERKNIAKGAPIQGIHWLKSPMYN